MTSKVPRSTPDRAHDHPPSPVAISPSKGPQNGPQGALCGPSASPSPPSIHETPRTLALRTAAFSGVSPILAGLRGPLTNRGRTVQIGFAMRFSRLLRSLCGPKSKVVRRPEPACLRSSAVGPQMAAAVGITRCLAGEPASASAHALGLVRRLHASRRRPTP